MDNSSNKHAPAREQYERDGYAIFSGRSRPKLGSRGKQPRGLAA